MLSVAEARARVLDRLRPTQAEMVALPDAWGRVTAAPVLARLTHPPTDVSAMDGYAVRAADAQAGARLRVVGAAPAGHPFDHALGDGEAVRLFTGSVVPAGADTVLPQEDVDRDGERVTAREAPSLGRHIRRQGQDFALGDVVAPAGRRLNARDVGLIAAANVPWVAVHRRPRVAVLPTGDEISMPGEAIRPGGIVSSNPHALAAVIRAAGGEALLLPTARDDANAIAAVADALSSIDMLVTTGGASVGEHDLVQGALAGRGFELDFWKIAMRPGKPLFHGRLGAVPVLGLPGNPVAALVCSVVFLWPALERMLGLPGLAPPTFRAVLGSPVGANDGRADHLRATLITDDEGTAVVTPFTRQDSSMMRALAEAGALVLREPHAPALPAGAPVRVIRLDALRL